MRYKFKRKTNPVILGFMIALLLSGNCHAAKNLLLNPSFEEEAGGLPSYWSCSAYDADGFQFTLESDGGRSGKNYAAIENTTENDSRLKQSVNVRQGACYRLSCWIKAINVGTNNKGANISVEGSLETSPDIRGTQDEWQYTEMYVRVGEGVTNLSVTVGIGGYSNTNTGKALFDDVSVEEVDTIPSGAVVATAGHTEGTSGSKGSPTQEQTGRNPENSKKGLWIVITFITLALGIFISRTEEPYPAKQSGTMSSKRKAQMASDFEPGLEDDFGDRINPKGQESNQDF